MEKLSPPPECEGRAGGEVMDKQETAGVSLRDSCGKKPFVPQAGTQRHVFAVSYSYI